jgi:hypothetical protein
MPIEVDSGGAQELGGVVGALRDLARYVAQVAVDIQSVPVVGQALSVPFANVATRISRTADALTYFEIAYRKFIDALKATDIPGMTEAFLDMVFPAWRKLRDNPLDFIIETIGNVYAHFIPFLRTPSEWLREQMLLAFPDFELFFRDPKLFLQDVVASLIEELGDIIRDPIGWLKFMLCQMLNVDMSFWDDPFGNIILYIMRWIEEHIKQFADWVRGVGEKILRYLYEGVL